MKEVLDFIANFKGSEDVFLHGCCYWFAHILEERFNDRGYMVDIFHDPIEGHFIARFIEDFKYNKPNPDTKIHFFDIRGDVTDLYNEEDLENVWVMQNIEEKRWGRLMCDCRDFISPDKYPVWLKN